jgi:hyperosmotically inducible protein
VKGERSMRTITIAVLFAMLAGTSSSLAAQAGGSSTAQPAALTQRDQDRITREVRHQLVLLPYYGVFDNLAYKVDPDGTVTLLGQVRTPVLKSDAENAVKNIEGVERVNNQIQVLPASPGDDRIRRAVYRAIYGNPALDQYGLRAVPPIHIIVNNGHVALEGVVANQVDKQVAGVQANTVPGIFSVDNNLQVENTK